MKTQSPEPTQSIAMKTHRLLPLTLVLLFKLSLSRVAASDSVNR